MRNLRTYLAVLLLGVACGGKTSPGTRDAGMPLVDAPVADASVDVGGVDVWPDGSADVDIGPPACVRGFVGVYPAVETGDQPLGIAVADFDRDGRLDVAAVANYIVNKRNFLTIARGDGHGGFGQVDQIAVGWEAEALVAADFNGDGAPDVAVALHGSSPNLGVQVFINRGDGTFGTPVTYPTAIAPDMLAAGDLDGDGHVDLVSVGFDETTNPRTNGLSVLKGMGDGTFAAMRSYTVGGQPSGVAVGDVNGDGIPDIVIADFMAASSALKTLLGQGGLDFAAPKLTALPAFGEAVALGDFDEDHRLDAVVGIPGEVVVVRGMGDGTFGAPLKLSSGDSTGLVAADVDGDGHLDVAATSGTYFNPQGETVSVARGLGDGSFMPLVSYQAGLGPVSVAVADLTGDGRPDLVVAANGGDVATVLPAIAGGFGQPATWATPPPDALVAADVNGDGRLDVVTSEGVVFAGLAGGGLAAPINQGTGGHVLTLPDWTGDGIPDLVRDDTSTSAGGLAVLPGVGDGTFGTQPISIPTPGLVEYLSSGDFDGDGHVDLAYMIINPSKPTVLFGDGHGAVAATVTASVAVNENLGVVTADFNGDQRADLAATIGTGTGGYPQAVQLLFGSSGQTLTAGPAVNVGTSILHMAGGDVDHDGDPDLIAAVPAPNGAEMTVGFSLVLLRNRGDGTFDQTHLADVPIWATGNAIAVPGDMAITDVDGDGTADLVLLYRGRVEIWSLDGGASATRSAIYAHGGDHMIVRDLDGDGAAEIVIARTALSTELLLLRSGCR